MSGARGDIEIFAHRERRKNLAFLRHETDTRKSSAITRNPIELLPTKNDIAGVEHRLSHDGCQQRCFADAVAPDNADALAWRESQVNLLDDHGLAVTSRDLP